MNEKIKTENVSSGKKEKPPFLTSEQQKWTLEKKQRQSDKLMKLVSHVHEEQASSKSLDRKMLAVLPEELVSSLEKYQREAEVDGLTQLYKRNKLFETGAFEFDQAENAEGGSVSVVSLDIDFFKAYNQISHTFGDLALQKVSKVLLEQNGEKGGFSVRLGGEEIFLYIQGGISEAELKKRAETVKNKIQKELNTLFTELDREIGVPGAAKAKIESEIVGESRNRKSYNEEWSKREDFLQAVNIVRTEELFIFPEKVSPSALLIRLNETIATTQGDKATRLQEVRAMIAPEIGTVTVGACRVEFVQTSNLNPEDFSSIQINLARLYDEKTVKQKLAEIKDKEYQTVFEIIDTWALADEDHSEELLYIIEKLKKERFGKVVDRANTLAESAKKKERNSLEVENVDVYSIDRANKGKIDDNIVKHYNVLFNQLAKLRAQRQQDAKEATGYLVEDQMSRSFEAFFHEYSDAQKRDMEGVEVMREFLSGVQEDRYYDGLTQSKNYDYLTKIVPNELARVRENDQDYSIISFDLDNLKAINDTWGHKLGDIALMTVSLEMQQGLIDYLEKDKSIWGKIRATNLTPEVIRATGGEEFILTLPGLNSEEAKKVFEFLQERVKRSLQKFTQKKVPKEFATVMNEETKETRTYSTYDERIKEFISGLKIKDENTDDEFERSKAELDKFGTVTAGIVSLRELLAHQDDKDYNPVDESGYINAGLIRQIADRMTEFKKDQYVIDRDGKAVTGRGEIILFAEYLELKKKQDSEQTGQAYADIAVVAGEKDRSLLAKIRRAL
jgi:diguanylate cyclase (GGDEF)-like protein